MNIGRLLVVDDEASLRSTLAAHLREIGHEVLEVDSATAALNRVKEFDPDIVLTDVQMPGMNGFELLAHLQKVIPGTDVVIFTGHGDVEGAIEAMKRGASDYLMKPLDLDETENTIEQCMLKRRLAKGRGSPEPAPAAPAHGLVGRHPAMIDVYKAIGAVTASCAPVLIHGESGTGKELVARAIHATSVRSDGPFVAVNCTAVPQELLESELFGHVKGAFTGAAIDRRGKFESARGGTLFLDEIGDTELAFQAALLRVLQENEYYPVGSDHPRRADVRIITATHRPLREMVVDGSFRQDLFYRLQVIEMELPPLRERRSDIPHLVKHLLASAAETAGVTPPVVPPEVMDYLTWRDWPGNVRELRNVITRAVILSRGPTLTLRDVGGLSRASARADDSEPKTLDGVRASVEKKHVMRVLQDTAGNKSRAARVLGISRPTLDRLIRDHQLAVPPA